MGSLNAVSCAKAKVCACKRTSTSLRNLPENWETPDSIESPEWRLWEGWIIPMEYISESSNCHMVYFKIQLTLTIQTELTATSDNPQTKENHFNSKLKRDLKD